MTQILMNSIPKEISAKVLDVEWSNTLIFEEIPCLHEDNAPEYKKLDCSRCQMDKAEKSLEDKLTDFNSDPNQKTVFKDNNGITKSATLDQIQVKRGKFEDCIGWEIQWKVDP